MTTTQLTRRRERSAAANADVEKARTAVDELANRLRTNADLTRQQTQALRNAEAEAKRLKRSLKTQARDKARLTKAMQKAVARAEKAKSRAAAMEQKYGESVLADLIRREKERDRATTSPADVPPAVIAGAEAAEPGMNGPAPARRSGRTGGRSPAESGTAPTSARATAARTTATKAAKAAASAGERRADPAPETPAPAAATATRTAARKTAARKTAARRS